MARSVTVDGEFIRFGARLRSGSPEGQVFEVQAPLWTAKQISALVKKRHAAFHSQPGTRESVEMAVVRKAIASQGKPMLQQVRGISDRDTNMELDMMLSPDAHSGAIPLDETMDAQVITVAMDGRVMGLDSDTLIPATGV